MSATSKCVTKNAVGVSDSQHFFSLPAGTKDVNRKERAK